MNPPKRVLLVEDEPDVRTVIRLALTAVGGFEVQACSAGQEALELLRSAQPDLILLDVMMPGLDGPATLRALRQLPGHATTPVIFMTAKVQSQEVASYLTLGALGVVAKPFDPMTLSDTIRDLWRRHYE